MTDKEIIYNAIIMWRNYIQTGNVGMSLKTAVDTGMSNKARMLNSDQQEFVIRLEELSTEVLNGKITGI